nr:YfhO family protein [Vicinamibacterales bacterium]
GMLLFLRALGLSRWASAFGGVAWLLNPFSLVWLEHPLAGVPPWLPWMLLAAERLPSVPRHRRVRAAAWLAVATALVLGGGHPHTGLFVAALGAGYALVRAQRSGEGWRAVALAAAALALGAALVAVQVLPFLEYVSLSRAATLRTGYELNPFFVPASALITAVVPNFLGHHGSGNFAGPTNYLEQLAYPGIAVWLLAAVGLAVGARAWRTWYFAGSATFALLVMYAAPGVHQFVSALPLVKAASLPRAACVALGSLAVLAAIGLDRVLDGRGGQVPGGRRPAVAAIALGVAALGLLIGFSLRERAAMLAEKALWDFALRWSVAALWLAVAVAVAVLARVHGAIGRSSAAIGLTAVLALDLLLFGRGFRTTSEAADVFPVVPEIARVQRDPGLFRVLGMGGALVPNAATVYGLQDVRGYDGLSVARYADLLDVALRSEGFLHVSEVIASPLIDLLNVKYVFSTPSRRPPEGWFTRVTEGEAALYVNNRVLPRAFLVDGYVVRDGNAARRTLRDGQVDLRRVALLEADPPTHEQPQVSPDGQGPGSATVVRYEDERVEVLVEATGRRLLVLTDVYYPGWRVSIDGRPAQLYRANFAFRAVPVPAGRHTVVFAYRPASVRAGLAVSASAALLILTAVLAERRRRARQP